MGNRLIILHRASNQDCRCTFLRP